MNKGYKNNAGVILEFSEAGITIKTGYDSFFFAYTKITEVRMNALGGFEVYGINQSGKEDSRVFVPQSMKENFELRKMIPTIMSHVAKEKQFEESRKNTVTTDESFSDDTIVVDITEFSKVNTENRIDYSSPFEDTRTNPIFENKLRHLGYHLSTLKNDARFGWICDCTNKSGQLMSTIYWYRSFASVAYHCKECGQEFFGSWHVFEPDENKGSASFTSGSGASLLEELAEIKTENFAKARKEISVLTNMQNCPCCNKPLSKEKGYYFEHASNKSFGLSNKNIQKENSRFPDAHIFDNIDAAFKAMAKYRSEEEKEKAQGRLASLVSVYDIPASVSFSSELINETKKSSDKLKDFIMNLIKLEMNIYGLQKHLPTLYLKESKWKEIVKKEQYSSSLKNSDKLINAEKHYNNCVSELENAKKVTINLNPPIAPAPPVLETPGLFNKKKVTEANEIKTANFRNAMALYEKLVVEYRENYARLQKEKEDAVSKAEHEVVLAKETWDNAKENANKIVPVEASNTPSNYALELITKEIAEAEKLMKDLYTCRNEMHASGIIFPKYQNVVIISTFYEYLMSGRCEILEGANGAYNIYENEMRADKIIDQLSQVIESLEKVKENQYLIYSELKEVNKNLHSIDYSLTNALTSLSKIDRKLGVIADNSSVIAYNTAVTAHYAKINAELTNALGFMVALK